MVEQYDGTCTGQDTEVEECNTHNCPSKYIQCRKSLFFLICRITFKILKFVFIFNLVDCEWGNWTIGECDKECGGGMRTNTRIPAPEAQYGGQNCTGHPSVTESCNIHECPGIFIVSLHIETKLQLLSEYLKIF